MNCRVVLVRPHIAANIGAAARVLCNFGLSDLVLVAPIADPTDPEARRLATHGEAVLDSCRSVPDLGEAVADCVLVAATSARTGGLFRLQSCGPPDVVIPRLVERMAEGRVALVFGPEPSGLSNEEVARCHYLIHIDTNLTCPALNLAQAVAICVYELSRCSALATEAPTRKAQAASFAEQERAFDHLRVALEAVHYLYGDKADSLMHGLRHLLARAEPTAMELGLLHGLARQLIWIAGRLASSSPRDET